MQHARTMAPFLALLFACGSETATPGGQGGRPGTGGSVPGSGGSVPGSGGSAPGSGGSVPGSGGQGAGGSAVGGASGTGGLGTGGAGQGGSSADGASESGTEVPADRPDTNPGSSLDTCFAGLPALTGNYQISNKRSADGAIQVRLALERIPDSVGTSGTVPWRAIRLGIVTPTAEVCVLQPALAYMGSRHNCNDTLTVSTGGVTYQLKWPDTDQVVHMRDKTTIAVGGAAPVPLQTSSCTGAGGANMCRSGGPC